MKTDNTKVKIWIALLALYLVWGSTYLGIRIAVQTIPPFLHAAVRFFISGVILLGWQAAAKQAMPTRKQWISCAIVGNLLLLGGNGLVSWAEQFIPSGITALIIAAVPMFLVVAEAVRPQGVKPNWQAIVGLCVGFVGIYILVSPSKNLDGQALNAFGVMALLVACMLWAIGSIYSKIADQPAASFVTTGAQMITGSIGLLVVSLLTNELHGWHITAVSTSSLLSLIYLIFAGSMIGFGSYVWLLKNAPISLVATYAYVNPVVAILLGNWLANEALEPHIWLATAIIIGSVMLINNKSKPTVSKEIDAAATERN